LVSGPSFRRPAEDSPGGRSDPIMIAAAQAGAMAPGDWQARRLVLVPHGGPVPLGRQPKQILPLCGIDGLRAQPKFGRPLGWRAMKWPSRSSGKHDCTIAAGRSWGQGVLSPTTRRSTRRRASIRLGALPPRTTNSTACLDATAVVVAAKPLARGDSSLPCYQHGRPPPEASRN